MGKRRNEQDKKLKAYINHNQKEDLVIKYEELAHKVEAMDVEKANPPTKKKVYCETCHIIGHSIIEYPNIPVYQETVLA